jgi:glycosyltransferase involved in cell wall biosynthesis
MVVISNGFSKFHLSVAAAEAFRRANLKLLITGAYPHASARRALHLARLDSTRKFRRLLARGEAIPDNLVAGLWVPEILHAAAMAVRPYMMRPNHIDALTIPAVHAYATRAMQFIEKMGPGDAQVYHYRAGFGLSSVAVARARGMAILCDHSITHPALVDLMSECGGALPDLPIGRPRSPFWRTVLSDIEQADLILVNSDFVKNGFLRLGCDPSRLRTIYWGIDNNFRSAIPRRTEHCNRPRRTPRLMFAGSLEPRKGGADLMEALRAIRAYSWSIEIAGSVDRALAQRYRDVLGDHRVSLLGVMSRAELAQRMTQTDAFVFPSRAEGSARVVFEALACGCFVITTPNSGSIVRDRVHGALVPPGNPQALADAIRHALAHPDEVARTGRRNAGLAARDYTQSRYGDQLHDLYRELTELRTGATSPVFSRA